MKDLTSKQVYAVYLVDIIGMTHKEAAEMMKITRAAVSRLIQRAKLKLIRT